MPDSPLLSVYRRSPTIMARGDGCYLFDDKGKSYLDFATGIGVSAFGHCNPRLIAAIEAQSRQLWHCSNLYHTPPLDRYAARLTANTFADKVFFCSSGTEAVEAGIKAIRRYHYRRGESHRIRILVAEGAFHGRTLGALSACAHAPSREGFGPLLEGFDVVAFHDIAALEAAIGDNTAGILLETIQGEGGIRSHSPEYLQKARKLCDTHGILLALDEVQCGFGRSGTLFAFEQAGIVPDIAMLAKGIGGGFPLAALLLSDHAASGMEPGSHGSTYGGNPLAMAVGDAALDLLLEKGFLAHVGEMGEALGAALAALGQQFPHVFSGSRGNGLMQALIPARPESRYALSDALRERGLLVAPAVGGVIRLLPPLVVQPAHIEDAARMIADVAQSHFPA